MVDIKKIKIIIAYSVQNFVVCILYVFCFLFQIIIFHMNKHEDLDLAILSVLLKGNNKYMSI